MSDAHDHPHPHPPGHEHEHDPDHGHGHGHGHAPGPAAASAAPTPPAAPVEDASSQALAEALRSSFVIVRGIMALLVVLFLFSGMFTVEPNQVAVKLRFGRPVGTGPEQLLKPGWHFGWPKPIDEVVRISVGQSHSVQSTVGWHETTPDMEARNDEPMAKGYLAAGADGYLITADGNIIHARANLKYRISDPIRFTFGFTNTTALLTNVVNNALLFAASRMNAEDAHYKDKSGFRDLVLGRVNAQIEALQLGIVLEPSDVETKVPADVRPAFEAVNSAEQDRSKEINDANGQRDEMLQRALGEAAALVNAGLSTSNRVVQTVLNDLRYFTDLQPYDRQDPALFRRRLLTETMDRVLTNAQAKFFVPDRADRQARTLWLQLSREPESKIAPPTR